ncbi:MAG: bi-domain-containing oxidoreductase, partial [Chromatiales bacterium]
MKQIAQYQDGRLEIQEVPAPQVPPGGILVRTTHSVISPGTEKMKVEQAKMNLLQKARARPDQVKKVLDTARTLSWKAAYEKVRNRLETPTPLGYSAAGEVIAVDGANTRFRVGDRVAVGGAECAHHAEVLGVPDLLAVKVPDEVDNRHAAFTTLASIAMQGVRQAGVGLGDRVLVVGQGLVGLLATAILRGAGARVLAVDLDDSRLETAKTMGAELVLNPRVGKLSEQVRAWTGGFGVDAALVCTAGSNAPVEQSVDALRDRGVMVIVGITDAHLEWKELYHKEIEVRYSRSYGPGRYDPAYEWGGGDYPIGYVRWTEQRNFESCLQLMRNGDLDLGPLISRDVSFTDSLAAYQALMEPGCADIGVVLHYDPAVHAAQAQPDETPTEQHPVPKLPATLDQRVDQIDVAGAGNFVKTMLLPHLKDRVSLGSVVTQTALSAGHVKEKFGFANATTDFQQVAGESGNRGLLIGTRHHLHAPMVVEGLRNDRHVFVEKPLCLNREELKDIDEALGSSNGSVMVGFNRRFAPASVKVREALQGIPGPKTVAYHVYAGPLDPESWYANYEESGGRILGEACHFLDFFCFLFASQPVRVFAQPIWPAEGRLPFVDSLTAQVEFADGSCGQLIYTAQGDPSYPKEVFTAYGAGLIARCENFQKLWLHQNRKVTKSSYGSKGHPEEMVAWGSFLQGQSVHPMPYEEIRQSMNLTFAV